MTTSIGRVDRLGLTDVRDLVAATAWPALTVLVTTQPASRMSADDAARLRLLADRAVTRLREAGVLRVDPLARSLSGLVEEAAMSSTGAGLAIFVSQATARSVRLPVPVTDRVVVDRGFATRDLVRALHRTPPHLVLLLHATSAHVYRGYADTYEPLDDRRFPLQRRFPVMGAVAGGDDTLGEFCDRVDSALHDVRRRHPSPLVLAGSEELLREFRRRSRNLHRLAAVVTGPSAETVGGLYAATREAMELYLLSREDEAVRALAEAVRTRPESVVVGPEACRDAVHRSLPAMLVVEEGLVVEGLVESVIQRGGWVAFTHDGRLDRYGGVALVTRRG